MGDAGAEQPVQHQPAQPSRSGMPDDVLEQILCFLPPAQVLRCGRTSKAFLRAALASLERAAWSPDPGAHGHPCRYSYPRAGGIGSSGRGGRLAGTPCLDLRDAGDAVDSQALSAMLGRIFIKPADGSDHAASSAGGAAEAEGGRDGGENRGSSSAAGKPAVLKGFAVRSAVIKDEVRFGLLYQLIVLVGRYIDRQIDTHLVDANSMSDVLPSEVGYCRVVLSSPRPSARAAVEAG